MGVVYNILVFMLICLPFLLIRKYRSSVILKVPLFTKNYTYEELREKYSYYKIKYNILLSINIVFFSIIFYMFYNIVNRSYTIKEEGYIILVNSKYWIIPAIICAIFSAYIFVERLMESILNERFHEFLIYMYVEKGCLDIRTIIRRIYVSNKRIKVYGIVIGILISIYSLLGFYTYINVENDRIVINEYGSIKKQEYSYNEIKSIYHSYSSKISKNKLGHSFNITFYNNEELNSESKILYTSSEEDYKIMKYIEKKSKVVAKEN